MPSPHFFSFQGQDLICIYCHLVQAYGHFCLNDNSFDRFLNFEAYYSITRLCIYLHWGSLQIVLPRHVFREVNWDYLPAAFGKSIFCSSVKSLQMRKTILFRYHLTKYRLDSVNQLPVLIVLKRFRECHQPTNSLNMYVDESSSFTFFIDTFAIIIYLYRVTLGIFFQHDKSENLDLYKNIKNFYVTNKGCYC